MEILGGAKVAGGVKATAFVFTGNNCSGAQTWQQGYNFGVGAGYALTLSEGHAGRLLVKATHQSGKCAEDISFAVIDGVVMTNTFSQFGSPLVSITADGTNIHVQAKYNNTHISYMLMYF